MTDRADRPAPHIHRARQPATPTPAERLRRAQAAYLCQRQAPITLPRAPWDDDPAGSEPQSTYPDRKQTAR